MNFLRNISSTSPLNEISSFEFTKHFIPVAHIAVIALTILSIGILCREIFHLVHRKIIPFLKPKIEYDKIFNKIHKLNISLPSTEKFEKTVKKVNKLISNNWIKMNYTHDNHALHDEVTSLTFKLRNNTPYCKIWQTFLSCIDKKTALYPDDSRIYLDYSVEIDYLNEPNKNPVEIEVKKIKTSTKNLNRVIDEVYNIERESFDIACQYPKDTLMKLIKKSNIFFLIARNKINKEVQGCLIAEVSFVDSKSNFHITSLARKANAAKCGVATQLLNHFLNIYATHLPVTLQVRKGNSPAIHLYQKMNFKVTKEYPSYYSYPTEDALFMVRPA
jgi:ribosomal protein S18 acetylase RimI-like enzyme